jgi:hypothetical protein
MFLSLKTSDLAVYFIAKLHYFEGYVLKERESVQDFYFLKITLLEQKRIQAGL